MKTNFARRCHLVMLMMVIVLSSCLEMDEDPYDQQAKLDEQLITEHLESNNITATKDNSSGIYYEVLKENTNGTPVEPEDVVSIRYVMKTLSGKLIDSLNTVQSPDTTVLFQHAVDPNKTALYPFGINYGIRLMNEGEKFRFYIPTGLAYGNYAYKTLIPSEAILIVDTEVVKVASEEEFYTQEKQGIQEYITDNQLEGASEQSSGIFYQKLLEGTGEIIKPGQTASVAYKGLFLNGEVFDESASNSPLGLTIGANNNIIPAFEAGVKLMKKGEKARIFIPSKLAYAESVQIIPGIIRKDYLMKAFGREFLPPYETLIFELEIKDIK